MSEQRRAFLHLARTHGWPVFPLEANGKRPLTGSAGVKDAEPVEAWSADALAPPGNIGLATGGGLVVVDLDRHDELADGVVSWEQLCSANGGVPDTYTVLTPSGGYHLYFHTLAEVRNSASKISPGVDVRGEGGYVVAPGSAIDGASYRAVKDVPVAAAPQWLIDALAVKRATVTPLRPTQAATIAPAPAGLAERYARAALGDAAARVAATPEGARNTTLNEETFSVAGLVGQGITAQEVVQAMAEAGMTAGMPQQEAWSTASRATQAGAAQPRDLPPDLGSSAIGQSPAMAGAVPEAAGRVLKVYDRDEMKEIPPPEWIIEGILPVGALAMYGKPGAGKSMVALSMACSIATGMSWYGHIVRMPGPVLYVTAEGVRGINPRVEAWEARVGRRPARGVHLVGEHLDLMSGVDAAAVEKAVRRVRPVLTVFDTWARCFGGNENDAQEVGQAVKVVDRLREATGTSVLLIHHQGTAVEDRMRGSTALLGALDWVAHCDNNNNVITIRNDQPRGKHKDTPPMPRTTMTIQPWEQSCYLEASNGWGGSSAAF